MNDAWLHLPIYLDGRKRFDAIPVGVLTVADAYERMDFVFNAIEYCFAEGRLMDVEIFESLEDLGGRIRRKDIPPLTQISDLVDRISTRYGFDSTSISESGWIRQGDAGEYHIWIDQQKIVAEHNEYLFGRKHSGRENIG